MAESTLTSPVPNMTFSLGQFGPYRVDLLDFGRFALDGGAMFGTVPRILWERVIGCDGCHRIPLATNGLLIREGRHVILVDCGNGDKWTDKQREMYAIAPTPSMHALLAPFDLTPDDVTHLLLTHLHFDHVGGATTYHNETLIPTFANAEVWVHEGEWQHALKPHARSKASYFQENLQPLEDAGKIRFCTASRTEILPGLTMQVTGGHTEHHQAVILNTSNADLQAGGLIFWGDILPTRHHVKTPWVMGYDEYPLAVMAVKESLLTEALEKRWLCVFEHEVDHPAGFIQQGEKGVLFTPLDRA